MWKGGKDGERLVGTGGGWSVGGWIKETVTEEGMVVGREGWERSAARFGTLVHCLVKRAPDFASGSNALLRRGRESTAIGLRSAQW